MPEPRIPPADESDPGIPADVLATVMARRDNTLTGLDRLLLHSPPVAQGWHALFSALAGECTLPFTIRELALLRIGHLTRARYPAYHHRRIALAGGMTEAQVDAVANWQQSPLFDPTERATLAYTDAMTEAVQVPDPVFAELARHFAPRQIVELTANIAAYNMVARFTEAVQLELP